MPSPDELLKAEEEKQAAEWGQYVATQPIDIGGVRAFNPGMAVPASHVSGGVVPKEAVKKIATVSQAKEAV